MPRLRFLNLDQDKLFESVEIYFWQMLRMRLSIKTQLRQIETPGLRLNKIINDSKLSSLNKNLDYLEKSWLSQLILMVLISLDDLNKNLDTAKSRLKSLDFKNLDREIKNFGLDCRDPQA